MFSGYHHVTDSKLGCLSLCISCCVSWWWFLCSHLHYFVTSGPGHGMAWLCSQSQARYGVTEHWTGGDDESQAEEELCTLHTITSYSSGSWYKCAQMRVVTCSGARTEWRLGHYCDTAPRPWHGHCLSDDINTVTLISLCNSYHLTDNNRWHCAVVCMCIAVAAGLIEFYQCCKL